MEADEIRRAVMAAIKTIAPEADLLGIRPDRPLREQVELDSMDWLNVIAGLNQRLSIAIPESDYGPLSTLDSIVAHLACRQEGGRGEPLPAPSTSLPSTQHVIDRTPVTVRPIRPGDMSLEADFVRHLSMDTRYQRFMLTLSELSPAKLHYLTDVDQDRHVALVATMIREGQEVLLGAVRYIVDPAGHSCEFAVAVDDAWQGTGLAGILMQALIDVARSRGLATMEGFVLATNTRMLRFASRLGFELQHDRGDRETVRIIRPLQGTFPQ